MAADEIEFKINNFLDKVFFVNPRSSNNPTFLNTPKDAGQSIADYVSSNVRLSMPIPQIRLLPEKPLGEGIEMQIMQEYSIAYRTIFNESFNDLCGVPTSEEIFPWKKAKYSS